MSDSVSAASVTVEFDAGTRAVVIEDGGGNDAAALIAGLGLGHAVGRPVLVVCGGADDLKDLALERARAIVGPAVASTAGAVGISVIDGGTASGVMLLAGAVRAENPRALPVLLGVAPAGLVTYRGSSTAAGTALEPNHTHFALAAADRWGGETELMMRLAAELAGGARVAVLLAGGGGVAKREAFEAATRGWPIFVLVGTGGCADEIASALTSSKGGRTARRGGGGRRPEVQTTADPPLRRIVADGDVRLFVGSEAAQLARQIAWELQDEPVLKDAWRSFATYDGLAKRARTTFERFQNSVLGLGIIATLLALVASATGAATFHWAAVAAPIVVSSAMALANRRGAGRHWVHLRAAAEAMKGEIYRYRARAGLYADARLPSGGRDARQRVLAEQLNRIDLTVAQTDAGSGSFPSYDGPLPPAMYGASSDDDGLSSLAAERYLRIRIADQLGYFSGRVSQLDRRRTVIQGVAVLAGGSGAILAAAGVEAWVGLTTAVSGAALSYLAYLQVDNTIVTYNQAASKLRCLERDWMAGRAAPRDLEALDALVTHGEAILGAELGGWVQQMTDLVNQLQDEQAAASRDAAERRRTGSGS